MKFLSKAKDGGPDSTVTGYWLIELKSLFSVVLLRFDDGSRDAYHSHAFNSLNWVLSGSLWEYFHMTVQRVRHHKPSAVPVLTRRSTFHKVFSAGTTWVLSFRGPWSRTWTEFNPSTNSTYTLTHGRAIVE